MTKILYNKKPKSIDKDTEIPIFDNQKENVNEFSIKNAAEIHDNALNWLFKTHNVNEEELRIEPIIPILLPCSQIRHFYLLRLIIN